MDFTKKPSKSFCDAIAALVPENKTPSEASEAENEVNVDVNDVKNV